MDSSRPGKVVESKPQAVRRQIAFGPRALLVSEAQRHREKRKLLDSSRASVSLRVKRLFSPLRSASRAEVAVRPTTPLPDVACEGDATASKIMCHD